MSAAKSAGRAIGLMTLVQMVGGASVNFVLAAPLFGSPGYLLNAAPHATQIGLSVLVGLAMGALSVAVAITAYPVFRQYGRVLALWFVVLATVGLAAATVEQSNVMSMLSLSKAYAAASVAERGAIEALRPVVAATRNWSHFIGLVVAGSTLFVMYAGLYRYRLVPRVLAAFGLVAVLLQITAVVMPLFGSDVRFAMLGPLGLSQLALALWLLAKGFGDPATAAAQAPVA